jgi:DNA modification methylase
MKSIKPTIDKDKTFPAPLETFLRHLDSMIKKNQEFYNTLTVLGNSTTPARMYLRDSTKKLPLNPDSIDLLITSPPYVTSYEYADLHQLSLLWFGDDPNNFKKWHKLSNDFVSFRKNFVGSTSKKFKNGDYNSHLAEDIVSKLSKVEKSTAADVANYFLDMNKAFKQMHRILKKEGKACVIIGNTSLRGVKILNAEVTIEQMQNIGFKTYNLIKRKISNKVITPWRDSTTGKFTSKSNPSRKRAYSYEYILIMEKA